MKWKFYMEKLPKLKNGKKKNTKQQNIHFWLKILCKKRHIWKKNFRLNKNFKWKNNETENLLWKNLKN